MISALKRHQQALSGQRTRIKMQVAKPHPQHPQNRRPFNLEQTWVDTSFPQDAGHLRAHVHAKSLWWCPTLACARLLSPWDSPGSILEWVARPSSRGPSGPRDQTHISCSSCLAGRFFTTESTGKLEASLYVKRNGKII